MPQRIILRKNKRTIRSSEFCSEANGANRMLKYDLSRASYDQKCTADYGYFAKKWQIFTQFSARGHKRYTVPIFMKTKILSAQGVSFRMAPTALSYLARCPRTSDFKKAVFWPTKHPENNHVLHGTKLQS